MRRVNGGGCGRFQVSPYALVVLPASDDPALKHFDHVYAETLLFFPTRALLLEWIHALLAAGLPSDV